MKEIPLTKGFIALVDDDDYDWLSEYKWYYNNGYARNDTIGYMHDVIMSMVESIEGRDVHHEDTNKLNNQKYNLKLLNRSLHHLQRYNSGVSVHRGKWRARIKIQQKEIFLGYYNTRKQALIACNTYKKQNGYRNCK